MVLRSVTMMRVVVMLGSSLATIWAQCMALMVMALSVG